MKRRVNIFNQIHKGLRAMLYDTGLALQLTDFTNAKEAEEVLAKLEMVLNAFLKHAEHEDHFILPVVEKHSKELMQEFDQEHEKDEFMTHRLHSLVNTFQQNNSDQARVENGEKIFRAFNEFIAFNLYHMNKEEEKLNQLLWAHYTDEQILDIQRELVKTIAPEENMVVSQWMMRGISDPEIVNWLKSIKNEAPYFVFQGIIGLAEQVLPAERWERIQCRLTEGLLLA